MWLLLLAFAIMLLAAAVQAVAGFGFAIVAVAALTLVTDPRTAVVGCGLVVPVLLLLVAVRERRHIRWRAVALLITAVALGLPVGLVALRTAPERLLTATIGVVAITSTVAVWRGLRVPDAPLAVLGLGMLAGVLQASTSGGGPLHVAAFQAMEYEPHAVRASIAALVGSTGVLAVVGFAIAGQLSGSALQVGLAGLPASLLGWRCGDLVFQRLHSSRLRRLMLGAMAASGAVLLVRAASH